MENHMVMDESMVVIRPRRTQGQEQAPKQWQAIESILYLHILVVVL